MGNVTQPSSNLSKVTAAVLTVVAIYFGASKLLLDGSHTVHVHNQAELYDALRAVEQKDVTRIEVDCPTMQMDSGQHIKNIFSPSKQCKIAGNNCVFMVNDSVKIAFDRSALDQNDALNSMQSQSFFFEDMIIQGSGNHKGKTIGIHLTSDYNGHIWNCHFNELYQGIKCEFCMHTDIGWNMFTSCYWNNIWIGIGHWNGATNTNSSSNCARAHDNRGYCASGMWCSYYDEGSDNIVWTNNTIEGFTIHYGHIHDGLMSPTCKTNRVLEGHVETQCDSAAFYSHPNGENQIYEDISYQFTGILFAVCDTTANTHVFINRLAWVTNGVQFRTWSNGTVWVMNDVKASPDMMDASRWYKGKKPWYYTFTNFTQSYNVQVDQNAKINTKLIPQ